MSDAPNACWTSLEAAHTGDLPLDAFEAWVYRTLELEPLLGADLHLELLAFDFRQPHARHELRKLIERIYAAHRPGALLTDHARRVATEYLEGRRDLRSTCRTFAILWAEGHDDWVPSEFVYIDSELDDVPAPDQWPQWQPAALRRLLARWQPTLRAFEESARAGCEAVLARLDAREGRLT